MRSSAIPKTHKAAAQDQLLRITLPFSLNQTVVIAGCLRVTVLAISPSRIELGVEAPRQITVDREEVHLRRQQQEIGAAARTINDLLDSAVRSPAIQCCCIHRGDRDEQA